MLVEETPQHLYQDKTTAKEQVKKKADVKNTEWSDSDNALSG